jgi:hypothetical protein
MADEGAYDGHPAIRIHSLGNTSDAPGICSPTP